MTTKRWLLDLIDEEEKRVREDYRMNWKSYEEQKKFDGKILDIDSARRLVEKGPDEP